MNIYDYQNKSLTPLFEPATYFRPLKREDSGLEYIRSLNLLLLAIKRTKEVYPDEVKKILPNLVSIIDSVECTSENGYQDWIEKKLDDKFMENSDKLNICHENNNLNDLENLLLILILQSFKPSNVRYDKQLKTLLEESKANTKSLVKRIRPETEKDKEKYDSFIKNYGKGYINCYMSLQILFISSYNSSFRKFFSEILKENRDKRFEEYKQQERRKGIKWDNKKMNDEFLKDNIFNGSSYYYFDIYSDFIESIKENEVPEMVPIDPHITTEDLPETETYTVLNDRNTNWWLLEKIREDKIIYESDLIQREIHNYPLFSLLDVIIAEVFFPGLSELYANFISVGLAYEDSVDYLSFYLSSGYGRLSYILTCKENGKNKEAWF